ncbi:hypothetical protein SAMN05216456_1270 [Devosia crocina]|uniref:Uncharacterized protein n=1 Tax=Devosia crocina TaxID=429728 RepID=A0A1I7N9F5_9HYPH|nr:hypothetical protein [Devosia crocina]SFV31213.1 hypothetical protein SAMN05216456_1270 [Devosia crocina]
MTHRGAGTEHVSTERLEKAVHAMAYIVLRHGEKYGPLLDRLADDLEARTRAPSARDRARQILAAMTREVSQHA